MITPAQVQLRQAACVACPEREGCRARYRVLEPETGCPTGAHAAADRRHYDAIAARAWPEGAERISGCCDRIE